MASISSTGLGSGLDVNSLVSQLVSAEKAPTANRLSTRSSQVQSLLSAYGTLKSAVSEFQDTLKKLKDPAAFEAHTASSSNTDLLKASADTNASPATYNVKVEALAQTQKLASAAYASSSAVVGTGRLDISAGGTSFSVTIGSDNQSLAGIRDAINNASGNPGVKATLINASDGAHLVITAAGSGTEKAVSINAVTDVGDSGDLSQLNYDPLQASNPMTVQSAAQDARIQLDGFTLTSSSNTFSDAIEGLTLTVAKADPDTTVEVKVGQDKATTRQALDQFITGYNKLRNMLNSLTAYNASTQSACLL
ncbi:MAG: flagellar filament capping protein FliD, partial [Perlucidibaca sp.]